MKSTAAFLTSVLLAAVGVEAKPLKVFILAGQSNMEGHARIETFDYIGDDPATAPLLKMMRGADGKPAVANHVWISYLTGLYEGNANGEGTGKLTAGFGARGSNPTQDGGEIGPEFTFGLAMDAALKEPVLLIKTAWGGRSLNTEFRPPSAGPYVFSETQIEQMKKQGKTRDYSKYSEWLADFIRDVRKDLKAPKMPFVIGVLGVDGLNAKGNTVAFRDAMAAPASMPEFKGNVAAVETAPFWAEELAVIDEKRAKVNQMAHLLKVKDKNSPNKDGSMDEAQQKEYLKKYEAELISPEEAAKWKRGASNAGYHYLGCAKTFALMGKAFAEANIAMMKGRNDP